MAASGGSDEKLRPRRSGRCCGRSILHAKTLSWYCCFKATPTNWWCISFWTKWITTEKDEKEYVSTVCTNPGVHPECCSWPHCKDQLFFFQLSTCSSSPTCWIIHPYRYSQCRQCWPFEERTTWIWGSHTRTEDCSNQILRNTSCWEKSSKPLDTWNPGLFEAARFLSQRMIPSSRTFFLKFAYTLMYVTQVYSNWIMFMYTDMYAYTQADSFCDTVYMFLLHADCWKPTSFMVIVRCRAFWECIS